jgi:electron transfer flavoprotein alpha/beta subunit
VAPVALQVRFSSGQIDVSEAEREVPFGDRCALEMARSLKPSECVVLSWAPASDESVLRAALALGAARLIRIDTPLDLSFDPLVVADGLAQALRRLGADLILFGEESGEHRRGVVGPMAAALLGLSHLGPARTVRTEGERLLVETWGDGETVSFLADPPLAVTVSTDSVIPGKPSPMALMKAFKIPIETVSIEIRQPGLQLRGTISNEVRRRGREILESETVEQALQILQAKLRERRVI